jgi:hypothetical protein
VALECSLLPLTQAILFCFSRSRLRLIDQRLPSRWAAGRKLSWACVHGRMGVGWLSCRRWLGPGRELQWWRKLAQAGFLTAAGPSLYPIWKRRDGGRLASRPFISTLHTGGGVGIRGGGGSTAGKDICTLWGGCTTLTGAALQ